MRLMPFVFDNDKTSVNLKLGDNGVSVAFELCDLPDRIGVFVSPVERNADKKWEEVSSDAKKYCMPIRFSQANKKRLIRAGSILP